MFCVHRQPERAQKWGKDGNFAKSPIFMCAGYPTASLHSPTISVDKPVEKRLPAKDFLYPIRFVPNVHKI